MNIKPILGFALVLCIEGCASIRTTTLRCTSLSGGQQAIISSDLNRMLANDGFQASTHSQTPWGEAWSNDSFSSLWKGRASFQIGASTNASGMDIDIYYYRGRTSANKALVDLIVGCVQSNAPSAKIKINAKTEFAPAFMGE